MFRRYAIYFTPDDELAHLGAAWLGWDLVRGTAMSHPDLSGLKPSQLTDTPRKYGFHATIKPPFFLNDATSATELQEDFRTLCAAFSPVDLPGLDIATMGRFIAMVPPSQPDALADMAAHVVRQLDMYRAPPEPDELEKRRQPGLSPAQEANLLAWGYPYVMDQFRFHMTLTGRLRSPPEPILKALRNYFPTALLRPFRIDSLTLVGEADNGFFHEIVRFHLKGH